MKRAKIKYTKILKSYKRNMARKNFKKNILLLFEYIKYKLEFFLENINLPNVLNLFKNKIFLSVSVIAFIILFNISIFAIKNKSNNNFYFNKRFDNSDKTYRKILSEMNPETNDIIENYLPKIPQITSIANIDGKVSEIFYDYISSDNTLNSDGVIGVKYEEYTIGEGENLTTISRKIGVNLDTLVSVNKITNANKLKPGQKIIIPNRNGLFYTIKQNENIEEVASK